MRDLCKQWAATKSGDDTKHPHPPLQRARQPTPLTQHEKIPSTQTAPQSRTTPTPPPAPKQAPPPAPVAQNLDILRGEAMRASVEKAMEFQKPDPSATRAALQSSGVSSADACQ